MKQVYKIDMDYSDMICPISRQLFSYPVIAEDGFTYEQNEITRWLKNNNYSPLTKQKIGKSLQSNISIKKVVDSLIIANPTLSKERYRAPPDYSRFKPADVLLYRDYELEKMKPADIFTILLSSDKSAIMYFLDNVVDGNKFINGALLLHYICKESHLDIIKYAFTLDNINNDYYDNQKRHAFHYIAQYKSFDEVCYMMSNFGRGVCAYVDNFDANVFHYIFRYQELLTIIYVMCNMIVPIEVDRSQWLPIHYAFRYNNYHVIKYLLSLNWSTDVEDIVKENKSMLDFKLNNKVVIASDDPSNYEKKTEKPCKESTPSKKSKSTKQKKKTSKLDDDDDSDDDDDNDREVVYDSDGEEVATFKCVYCEVDDLMTLTDHCCDTMKALGISNNTTRPISQPTLQPTYTNSVSIIGLIDLNNNLSLSEKKDLWMICLKN